MAAIIGSKDSTSLFLFHLLFKIKKKLIVWLGTQYAGRVIQQYSPKGKIVVEIIKDLHIYVGELLREFSHRNSRLPNKLVFYRTGVDDGSFQKVLDNEVRAIQRACQGKISFIYLIKNLFFIFK
jgi:hypothetical protein